MCGVCVVCVVCVCVCVVCVCSVCGVCVCVCDCNHLAKTIKVKGMKMGEKKLSNSPLANVSK